MYELNLTHGHTIAFHLECCSVDLKIPPPPFPTEHSKYALDFFLKKKRRRKATAGLHLGIVFETKKSQVVALLCTIH